MFRRKQRQQPIVFRCNQGKITYQAHGNGPPLVLIHGLLGSESWWRRNVPVFARHFTVYAIQLAGYGTNRAWRPLRIQAAADCIGAFIGSLPHGRAHVIGHSMGGHIASYVAVRHPHHVDRLVLTAASGLLRGDVLRVALRLPAAAWYGQLDFVPILARDALRAGPISLVVGSLDILSDDVSETLASIVSPTLLIWGERDVLVPRELGEAANKTIPSSRLVVIKGAGHNVMWDRSREFNDAVLDFLLDREADADTATS